jgi:UDP-N-acetylglucosamine 2-epimerase
MKKKILTVIGARPQFVKAAIFSNFLKESKFKEKFNEVVIHTGQHYDSILSDIFFSELKIPTPKYNLKVGSHSVCHQISVMIDKLEPIILKEDPDVLLVYGDTNSSLSASIVGAHLNIPVVHVEAGERIFRRKEVPEEINRIITDNVSSLCLTSTKKATSYLKREGMADDRVSFVGDLMFDLFIFGKDRVNQMDTHSFDCLNLDNNSYDLATIHRPQNTNNVNVLFELLDTLGKSDFPVFLPLHPRVRNILNKNMYKPKGNLILGESLGYFGFMKALLQCRKVITDSGGVAREAFFAKKPCIIPMESSWWTEIIESGWGVTVDTNNSLLLDKIKTFNGPDYYPDSIFGDGNSASKIASNIELFLKKFDGESNWHQYGRLSDLPKTVSTDLFQSNYKKLIKGLLENGYKFPSFVNYSKNLAKNEHFVLMRHDIDISIEKAVEIAKIEYELGVTSTYFFMIRNDFYNIFSKSGTRLVNEILSLGHHLGIHFDCSSYDDNITEDEINKECSKEVEILKKWFNKDVDAVSFHRPSNLVLEGSPALTFPIIHTYTKTLFKHVHYVSDSRGEWKYGHPFDQDAFKNKKPIQILTHPIWWSNEPTSPYNSLLNFIDEKKVDIDNHLAKNCEVFKVGALVK